MPGCSSVCVRSRQATKFAGAMTFRLVPPRLVSHTATIRSGSWYGSGRSRTVRTTLKIADVAPMPRASVSSAAAVKRRRPAQYAKAVTDVTNRVLEKRRPKLVPRALLDAFHPAELEPRQPSGLGWTHARLTMLLGLLIDVKANLFVEAALERLAALDRTDPSPGFGYSSHRRLLANRWLPRAPG